ncbi:hypothetical protein Z043_107670 [Scleropages formosus]|uniref:Uncharacterized protein n=1 Tax=Scleropages formosus TaxID=113540 RepID=A0A0N8K0W3_SCLFO|nr:hypothetical protein Z043_107670 [Scleropages formosus]
MGPWAGASEMLLWSAGACRASAPPAEQRDDKSLFERILDIVKRAKERQGEGGESFGAAKPEQSAEGREPQDYKSYNEEEHVVGERRCVPVPRGLLADLSKRSEKEGKVFKAFDRLQKMCPTSHKVSWERKVHGGLMRADYMLQCKTSRYTAG